MASKMVLVVDDDQSILDFINEALTDEGYDVVTASDTEAVQAAHEKHPDVILLDIQMPTLDGVEISRRLRAETDTAAIPIIVMSARDRLDATVSGMPVNDQLVKPFPLRELYEAVATWSA